MEQYKEIFEKIEDEDYVRRVLYKEHKILVLTRFSSHTGDFVNRIASTVAESADERFGMEPLRGDDRIDEKIVLSFYPNCDEKPLLFYMYGAACGISSLILADIYNQVDSDTLRDLAHEILELAGDNSKIDNVDELLDIMHARKHEDKSNTHKDSASEDEDFSAFDL